MLACGVFSVSWLCGAVSLSKEGVDICTILFGCCGNSDAMMVLVTKGL
jgi:hypothetical protein